MEENFILLPFIFKFILYLEFEKSSSLTFKLKVMIFEVYDT